MIQTEIHTDDYVMQCEFDATPWFEQASTKDIDALIECEWRGDYPADAVAMNHPDMPDNLKDLFKYLELIAARGRKSIGFEVIVDESQALEWINNHTGTTTDF